MFRSVILILILFGITLTAVHCTECKPHEKTCTSLDELGEEENCFTEWLRKICPTNETVINKGEVDGYKGCIKTHLEPCIQGKDEVLKKIFVELLNKFDLTHVCSSNIQKEIEDNLIDVYMDHKEQLDKKMGEKCSVLKQAMHEVMVCAKIK